MKYINFHTHTEPENPDTEIAIVSCVAPEPLQEGPEGVWFSYGIHPWYIHGQDIDALLNKVKKIAANHKVIAIGEAGLDKIKGPALGLQKKIFCQQVDISEDIKKPLIIHSVKANNEILNLHKKMTPSQPWVIHGFSGHPQEMEQFVKQGFYLSFGPKILYHQNNKAAESLERIPGENLFLETDHTNKSISALYIRGAEIRNTTVEKLGNSIEENFDRLFRFE